MFGPRFSLNHGGRLTPFAQGLVGGARLRLTPLMRGWGDRRYRARSRGVDALVRRRKKNLVGSARARVSSMSMPR
jgi:hypothetical protein